MEGDYQLSYTGGTSHEDVTLTVIAPASKLAFIEQPAGAIAGQTLSRV